MPGIVRDVICFLNGGKPSAQNLFEHYTEGVNGIYDFDELSEIAEEGCVSYDEAWIVADLLKDGIVDESDVPVLASLGYSGGQLMEMDEVFSFRKLTDGYCARANYHRAKWIVDKMDDTDLSKGTQAALLDELGKLSSYAAPCSFRGDVNDSFTDPIFEMFEVEDSSVRSAAARSLAAFWEASSNVDGAEIVDDMVDSEFLNVIIENAYSMKKYEMTSLFRAILSTAESELDASKMQSLYVWIGRALHDVEKINASWIGFVGEFMDMAAKGKGARFHLERAIRHHKTEILEYAGKNFSLLNTPQQLAVIRICQEIGLESMPYLATICKNGYSLDVRQAAERSLAKMGLFASGPHTEYESNGLLLSILKKPSALMAFVEAIDILDIDPTDYCGVISKHCDGSEMMIDILSLCNGTLWKYRQDHRSIEKRR